MDSVTLKAAHEFSLLKVIVTIGKHFQASDSSIQVTLKRSHTPRCFIIGVGGSFGNTCSWCTPGWADRCVQLPGTPWNTLEHLGTTCNYLEHLGIHVAGGRSWQPFGDCKKSHKIFRRAHICKNLQQKRCIFKFSRQKRISRMLSVKISLEEWSLSLKSLPEHEVFCWKQRI